jgi:hypothetical protein
MSDTVFNIDAFQLLRFVSIHVIAGNEQMMKSLVDENEGGDRIQQKNKLSRRRFVPNNPTQTCRELNRGSVDMYVNHKTKCTAM